MQSLQVPEQIAAPNVGKAKHRLANLSSFIQCFEIAQDQTEAEEGDEGLLLGGASSGLIGVGLTTQDCC